MVEREEAAPAEHDPPFRDRRDAGRRLGEAVRAHLAAQPGGDVPALVIALPRGGVLVGAEVARAIDAPLDVWNVRKVGVPGHEELGLGAVAEGGAVFLSDEIVALTKLPRAAIAELVARKREELARRTRLLRGGRPAPVVTGKIVVLVDDGIATGGTVRAAARALRAQGPRQLVMAAPIAAADTAIALGAEVDGVVFLETPAVLHAVGAWYDDFSQVADEEVMAILLAV